MIFDEECASDTQTFLALPKRRIHGNKIDAKMFEKKNAEKNWGALKDEMSGIV